MTLEYDRDIILKHEANILRSKTFSLHILLIICVYQDLFACFVGDNVIRLSLTTNVIHLFHNACVLSNTFFDSLST